MERPKCWLSLAIVLFIYVASVTSFENSPDSLDYRYSVKNGLKSDDDGVQEQVGCKDDMKEKCEKANATCAFTENEEYKCVCIENGEKYEPTNNICQIPCESDEEDFCKHGSICEQSGEAKFCKCKSGTSSFNCENVDDCSPEKGKCGAGEDVACIYNVEFEAAECSCNDPTKIFDSTQNICRIPCQEDFCKNEANCTGEGEHKFCNCNSGTSGDDCGVVNKCDEEPEYCGKDKESVQCVYASEEPYAQCKCKDSLKQFDRINMTCRVPCQEDSCKNGAICAGEGEHQFCNCNSGTSGDDCGVVNTCDEEPEYCGKDKESVECIYDNKSPYAQCKCNDSLKQFDRISMTCRVPCEADSSCNNGATCKGEGEHKFCKCNSETSGDDCGVVNKCNAEPEYCGEDKESVQCVYASKEPYAQCKCNEAGKEFDRANMTCRVPCQENSCKNEGTCVGEGEHKFCNCKPGTSGDDCGVVTKCEAEPEYCGKDKENIQCVYASKEPYAQCKCKENGKALDKTSMTCRVPCQENSCKNGGTCTGEEEHKFCICKSGTSGDDCGVVNKCDAEPQYCGKDKESVQCVYDSKAPYAQCKCKESGKWFDRKNMTCRVPCQADSCKNEANCAGEGEHKFCNCNSGTSGDDCGVVNECDKEPKYCGKDKEKVECVYDSNPPYAQCKCNENEKQFDRTSMTCRVPCQADSCKNGATCTGEGEHQFCKCNPGTSRDDCGVVNKCNAEPKYCGEDKERVECVYDNKPPYAQCKCNETGKQFDRTSLTCRAPCETDANCENGAKCVGTGDLKFCKCNSGTSGDDCKTINDCIKKICGENGDVDCTYNVTSFKTDCICHEKDVKNFDTKRKECRRACTKTENCENGAKCEGGFCACLKGTSGDACQTIDQCEHGLCGNDEDVATCGYDVSEQKAYCTCTDTKTKFDNNGKVCRKVCSANEECVNGELCWKMLDGKKTCACEDGKGGDDCKEILGCETLRPICEEIDAKCEFDDRATEKATCVCNQKGHKYDPINKACRPLCTKDADCATVSNMICHPTEKVCKCKDGYEGTECSIISGCKDLEKDCQAANADCVFDENTKSKANCKCKNSNFVYENKKCETKFCKPNPCKSGSKCEYDDEAKAGVCKCGNGNEYYDYSDGACKAPDQCILKKNPCRKNEKCVNGKCLCSGNFEEDKENKGCKLKACKDICFSGAECSEEGGRLKCKCPKEKYFDGTKCADGKCFLGDFKVKCAGCSDKVQEKDGKCEAAKSGTKLCNEDCGYGYCLQAEGKEYTCECIKGLAERKGSGSKDKCVLKKNICASQSLTKDFTRCDCGKKYKQADDGKTCVVKTCDDVQDVCNKRLRRECSMSWKGATVQSIGYTCKCMAGYVVSDIDKESCTDPCSNYAEISKCHETGQLCYNSIPSKMQQNTVDCKCPPSLKKTADSKDCSGIEKNVFVIRNIPVLKKKYELDDGGIDEILLGSDLIQSMRTMFLKTDYTHSYLQSYKSDGNILTCSVWMEAKKNISDQLNRVLNQTRSFEKCGDDCGTSLTLWPPSTLVSKDHLKEVKMEGITFCSADVKNALCGEHAACDQKTNKCSCKKGFKTLAYTIKEYSGQYRIQRCEDIDECQTGIHKCPGNTTCANTPGDYECQCKPNYKKKNDPLHNREKHDKNDCYDLCTPDPCSNGGTCVPINGTFDCRCPLGFEGTFCGRSDLSFASAKKSTAVVGAVLGVILALTLIAFFLFYWRVKKNSYSEDFEPAPRQDHASEMVERRPMRGVINKSYE